MTCFEICSRAVSVQLGRAVGESVHAADGREVQRFVGGVMTCRANGIVCISLEAAQGQSIAGARPAA